MARKMAKPLWEAVYEATLLLLMPVSRRRIPRFRDNVRKNSVLHISAMVHVPWFMVQTLRRHGVTADYMAGAAVPSGTDATITWSIRAGRWFALSRNSASYGIRFLI
jgi:hypothetical protein